MSARIFFPTLIFLLLLAAGGCSDPTITDTKRSAVEEVLICTVIERSLNHINFANYEGKTAFMDYSNLDPQVDKAYVQGYTELRLAEAGVITTTDEAQADIIIKVLSGVLATDHTQLLIGTPSLPIPLPNTSVTFQIPEIALFKRIARRGYARISMNIVRAKDKHPLEVIKGVNSRSEFNNWTIFLVPFTSYDAELEDDNPADLQYDIFE